MRTHMYREAHPTTLTTFLFQNENVTEQIIGHTDCGQTRGELRGEEGAIGNSPVCLHTSTLAEAMGSLKITFHGFVSIVQCMCTY